MRYLERPKIGHPWEMGSTSFGGRFAFQKGGRLGMVIAAITIALPPFGTLLADGAGWTRAAIAGTFAGAGMVVLGFTWVAVGRPEPRGMLRRQPAMSLLFMTIFVAGFIPTVMWGK
jgi:hypothetical protein